MNLDFSLINILILFGAVQGIIFSCLLFASKRHPGAFYLGLVMLALVYNGLETFNWSSGLEDHITFFDFYPFVTIFLLGPSFYLYYQRLYQRSTQVSSLKKALFFTPFFFQFLFLTVGWVGTLLTFKEVADLRVELNSAMNFYLAYSEVWSLLVFLGFTVFSWRDFSGDPEEILSVKKSSLRRQDTKSWVRNMLIFQAVLGIFWSVTLLIPYLMEWPFEWSHYYPVEILLVVFLYWIAIVGYSKLKTIRYPDSTIKQATLASPSEEAIVALSSVTQAMEEDRLFLNPELSLSVLATHTGVPAKVISLTLNQLAGSNFNDFVNSYRVEAFCIEIQKEENSNLTLIGVASRCGFNSAATFQRTFKKMKGETPKVFANRQKEILASS